MLEFLIFPLFLKTFQISETSIKKINSQSLGAQNIQDLYLEKRKRQFLKATRSIFFKSYFYSCNLTQAFKHKDT